MIPFNRIVNKFQNVMSFDLWHVRKSNNYNLLLLTSFDFQEPIMGPEMLKSKTNFDDQVSENSSMFYGEPTHNTQ